MVKYRVEIYGYGGYEGDYTINASSDDDMRREVIYHYGNMIRDDRTGCTITKEGTSRHYGHIEYIGKRWYWQTHLGTGIDETRGDFEINPATGGKMYRYIEGYDVEYTLKNGKKMKKHLKFEGIEFTRYVLMSGGSYKDAKQKFTLYKAGKKMGDLAQVNGKWIWTSANARKYYVWEGNGQITSQIR